MALYIGLMSGTSMDGIDAVILDLPANTLVCALTKKYSVEIKQRLEQLITANPVNLADVCQLNTLIGREFSGAVHELLQKAQRAPDEITAIGSHGQTVCHDALCSIPYTLQLGCAFTIASLTGIKVIADFRTADLVNGGQGAPFAPVYHQELFGKSGEGQAIVNIGGIANITLTYPNEATQGWDIGPGNCLMDAWINQHQGKSWDQDGLWAKQGEVLVELLEQLLSDPFFALASPKSIGKEYFSLSWLGRFMTREYKPVDIQATLLALTAHSIAATLLCNKNEGMHTVYLCGGGIHNQFLMSTLTKLLPDFKIKSTDHAGIDPDYLEAMMFAWLASRTLSQSPVDLSSITGAKGPAILGAIYNSY